ncbi:MAG: GNAT family N-acetyltransferase [Solirubrobacteraceae bacterium]
MALAYPDPSLTDGVIRLRPWRLDDTNCVRQAATDPDISVGTTVPTVYTVEEGASYIQRQWSRIEDGEGISLVVADAESDEALGQAWIAIRPQPGVAGLGYWIVPDARRRGIATRAVRLASDWALGPLAMARVEA